MINPILTMVGTVMATVRGRLTINQIWMMLYLEWVDKKGFHGLMLNG